MIWAITQGSYSDYHVVGVLDNEEDANELCKRMNEGKSSARYDTYEVEEFDHLDKDMQPVVELRMEFRPNQERLEQYYKRWPQAGDSQVPECEVQWYEWRPDELIVWGSDHERVKKVYGERKAEITARLKGLQ